MYKKLLPEIKKTIDFKKGKDHKNATSVGYYDILESNYTQMTSLQFKMQGKIRTYL